MFVCNRNTNHEGDKMNSQRRTFVTSCTKNGRKLNALIAHPGERGLFNFDSLADAGMVCVVAHGAENVYFEFKSDEGTVEAGFCKCL